MQMLPVSSSRITHMGYDDESATVYVRFANGTPWRYVHVPPTVWRAFVSSSSKGRFIHDVLDGYRNGRA